MSKVKVNTIYSESDYRRFRLLDGNRDAKAVNKILESIDNVGYVSCPILVNENMEIVDGQNRFYALQELGLPIEYYIVEGVGIQEARFMNIGRSNWTTMDYVKSYMYWDESKEAKRGTSVWAWTQFYHKPYANDWNEAYNKACERKWRYME